MSIEIKVYLNTDETDANLCFHAVINSRDDYDLFVDLNETYEVLMLDALKGNLQFNYIDSQTYDKSSYAISGSDYEQNIDRFVSMLHDFYGLHVIKSSFGLHANVGVRLVGAGYRGNPDNPMLEHSQFIAMHSIHGIKTALFPANNTEYRNDDIYIKKAPGSLILTLEATKTYDEPMAFMQEVYNDIENETIDPFKYENIDVRQRYQSIIKNLSDLNNQKRLKEFFIIIGNNEYPITKRTYLKEQSKSIYFEDLELTGHYEGYKKSSNSFELYVPNRGKFFCHLDDLERSDYTKYQSVYNILSELDYFNNTIRMNVIGKKTNPKTINVRDIELI